MGILAPILGFLGPKIASWGIGTALSGLAKRAWGWLGSRAKTGAKFLLNDTVGNGVAGLVNRVGKGAVAAYNAATDQNVVWDGIDPNAIVTGFQKATFSGDLYGKNGTRNGVKSAAEAEKALYGDEILGKRTGAIATEMPVTKNLENILDDLSISKTINFLVITST